MSELSVGSLSGLAANSYVIDVASGSTLDLSAGAVFPAGSIIQVVNFTTDTLTSTTSTSYVNTSLTSSITPSSATSKILVMASAGRLRTQSSAVEASVRLYRGDVTGTDLTPSEAGTAYTPTADTRTTFAMVYLDSPATTSSVTYTIGLRSLSPNTTQFGLTQSMVLMEVAG